MAGYFQLSKSEIHEIAQCYLVELEHFELMKEGASNTSYLLSTLQGKFVLTLFDKQSADEVLILAKALQYLESKGFPSNPLLPIPNGDLICRHDKHYLILKRFIEGQVHIDLNDMQVRQVGMALAQLHRLPVPDFLPKAHPYGLDVFSHMGKQDTDVEFEDWLRKRGKTLREKLPEDLPRGVIHGDLFSDNMLFDGEELRAIIDFEDICEFPLAFDLGMTIVGCCREGLDKISLRKARVLLDSYQSERSLDEMEKDTLQLQTDYAATLTANWRFWKYHLKQPTPERQHMHRFMMAIAEQVAAFSPEDFKAALFARKEKEPHLNKKASKIEQLTDDQQG